MCIPPINARQQLVKHVPTAMNIFSNRKTIGHMSVCVSPIVSRQQLGKDVPAATKNSWRRCFLCGPCPVKESRQFFPELLVNINEGFMRTDKTNPNHLFCVGFEASIKLWRHYKIFELVHNVCYKKRKIYEALKWLKGQKMLYST
jgi:hypothetical protein